MCGAAAPYRRRGALSHRPPSSIFAPCPAGWQVSSALPEVPSSWSVVLCWKLREAHSGSSPVCRHLLGASMLGGGAEQDAQTARSTVLMAPAAARCTVKRPPSICTPAGKARQGMRAAVLGREGTAAAYAPTPHPTPPTPTPTPTHPPTCTASPLRMYHSILRRSEEREGRRQEEQAGTLAAGGVSTLGWLPCRPCLPTPWAPGRLACVAQQLAVHAVKPAVFVYHPLAGEALCQALHRGRGDGRCVEGRKPTLGDARQPSSWTPAAAARAPWEGW